MRVVCEIYGRYMATDVLHGGGKIVQCCRRARRWRSRLISIPYGSIKRPRSALCCVSTLISIPYGSIKSMSRNSNKKFLTGISIPYGSIKRISTLSTRPDSWISIPYGSIKSFSEIRRSTARQQFQFLMVRLKVVFDSRFHTISFFYFNSLWFD